MKIERLTIFGLSLTGTVVAANGVSLDPVQPVLLPQAASAKHPLSQLGGNGPWHAAPDVHGIGSAIPDNCHIDQAAYVLRHGSRYPDAGAYQGWVDMALRFKSGNYTATGPLSFFHDWNPPLSHPDIQIAQVSQTGYKELFDLGYTLRTRYPNLYNEGDKFTVWANNYTRVLQSAQLFLHGYLGTNASLGTVVSVTGKGFASHLGDTLAPSDMCPSFTDNSDAQQAAFVATWLPAFKKRLARYIQGSLELDDSMYGGFPYLCGFESQIRGHLSPFCDTFTEAELAAYEYTQDLRYYYGVGPAANVASKMMVPFLHALVDRFVKGPGETGKGFHGEPFDVPKLLLSFLNDGQLVELAVASGAFDGVGDLPTDHIAQDRLWRSSNISPMRGTIAFERLNCIVSGTNSTSTATTTTLRRTCRPRRTSTPAISRQGSRNETFIRIRLNEAVYPLPSCQDGPGKSCSVRKYSSYLSDKLVKNGKFADICNATQAGTPTKVLGASFFTNLAQDHLKPLKP